MQIMDYRNQAETSQNKSFQQYLTREFGKSSQVYEEVLPYIFNRVVESDSDSRISKHFEFWQESTNVKITKVESEIETQLSDINLNQENNNRAEEFLYSLQSYYSLLLNADRLVSIRKLSSGAIPERASYQHLRSSYRNVLDQPEDKPFQPWLEQLKADKTPIGRIIPVMADAPERGLGEDGFQDIYQDIIANPFRKALGEFYTREWLADLILDRIGYDGSSLLDPACGSGVFLVKAAKRVVSKYSIEKISTITGFDLNPVAVAAAKSNLLGLIATYAEEGSLSPAKLREINLPVYWTNSIIWRSPDLHGNNITLLSPLAELRFPEESEQAMAKVREDLETWAASTPFSGIFEEPWFRNIADSFTAPVRHSPWDFVVGNPPWVSPDRMPKDYRDRVKDLLEESGFLEPFQPDYLANRFPNKQFVAALPFYEVSMRNYVASNGKCAYLVTSSLLKSMNGGGFRKQMQEWDMTQLLDFTPYTNIHQGANSWGCVPVINGRDSADTKVEYEYFTPVNGSLPAHEGSCGTLHSPDEDFHVCSWDVSKEKLPLIPSDAKSPWFTAPESIIEIYRQMLADGQYVGENYRLTRGLVTGRNSVYVINKINTEGEKANIQTRASEGSVRVDSDRIYPFVEGKNLTAWDFDYRHLLLPYDVPDWTPIPEAKLESAYPQTKSYFESNKAALKNRRTHTISSQMENGEPYYVVESREVIGKMPVVGVREVAPYLEAAVIPPSVNDEMLGTRKTVVAHTLNFVVPGSEQEAYYIAGIFNSWPVRTLLYDLAQPKGGRPGKRFDMYLLSSVPLPEFDPDNSTHQKIANLAKSAHSTQTDDENLNDIETALNRTVAEGIYSITADDLTKLKQHYKRLSHTPE